MHRRNNILPKFFLLLLLLAGAWTAYATRQHWLPLIDPNQAGSDFDRLPPADRLAAEAAVTGTQAFFSFSSQAGKDAWLEKLCQISSKAGCNLYTLGAARLWESLGTEPFEIQATAKAVEKVHESKTASQVWKVEVSLSQPLPGSEKTSDTSYVLVVEEEGSWKFERFLSPQEAQPFSEE